MSIEQFRLREPDCANDLDLLARHWDACGDPVKPLEVYSAWFRKLRSFGINQWGSHPIINHGPRFKRQRKVTECLV